MFKFGKTVKFKRINSVLNKRKVVINGSSMRQTSTYFIYIDVMLIIAVVICK